MARSNGGLIGKSNKASFGKSKVTSFTSSGNFCTSAVTRVVETLVIAGGGGGGSNEGGGGGAGGYRELEVPVCGSTQYSVTVGAAGAAASNTGAGLSLIHI